MKQKVTTVLLLLFAAGMLGYTFYLGKDEATEEPSATKDQKEQQPPLIKGQNEEKSKGRKTKPTPPASYGLPRQPKRDAVPAKPLPTQEGVVEREKVRSPLPPQGNPYAGVKLLFLILLGAAILGGGWYCYTHCDFAWISGGRNGNPNPTNGTKPLDGGDKPTKNEPSAASREKAVEGWLQTKASQLESGSLEGYLNGAGKKVTLALVDIDATLIVKEKEGAKEKVNRGLIDALKEEGIKDMALFTQMGDRRMAVEKGNNPKGEMTRWQLIQALEGTGFKVWGVITPADSTYKRGLGAAYKDCAEGNLERKATQEETQTFQMANGTIKNPTQSSVDFYQHLCDPNFDNKRTMFRYFMERCSQFEGTLFFIDDGAKLNMPNLERDEKSREVALPTNPIFYNVTDEYHKNSHKKFELVSIQVPYNWHHMSENLLPLHAPPQSNSACASNKREKTRAGVNRCENYAAPSICKKLKKNMNLSIGPQTKAYYAAILSRERSAQKVVAQGKPVIYTMPPEPLNIYYLDQKLKSGDAPSTWDLWNDQKGTKTTSFLTLIKPSN